MKSKPTQQRQIWLHGLCRNKNSEALALEVKEREEGRLPLPCSGRRARRRGVRPLDKAVAEERAPATSTNVSPALQSFFP